MLHTASTMQRLRLTQRRSRGCGSSATTASVSPSKVAPSNSPVFAIALTFPCLLEAALYVCDITEVLVRQLHIALAINPDEQLDIGDAIDGQVGRLHRPLLPVLRRELARELAAVRVVEGIALVLLQTGNWVR